MSDTGDSYVPLDNLADTKRGVKNQTTQTSAVTICFLVVIIIATVGGLVGYMYENPIPVKYNDRQYRVEWSGKKTGRVLLMFSNTSDPEPRFSIKLQERNSITGDHEYYDSQYIFGADVENSDYVLFNESTMGFPVDNFGLLPSGKYYVQAVLNVYTTFRRADGFNITLHMDRGEGQQWNTAPGNLYNIPKLITVNRGQRVTVRLDNTIPPITPPVDTFYVKYVSINSELLSTFWGTNITLGASVLLPYGYDTQPNTKYPLVIYHGHYSREWATPVPFREDPPDVNPGAYDYTVQQYGYQLYLDWTNETEGSPFYGRRMIIVCIQHANPYYDDSYAVDSPNVGPYGTAIEQELIVGYLEKNFRILEVDQNGQGWARVTYGGSTGGWEALAVQVFNPDFYNGAWINCPDPVDFHAFELINLYSDTEAYFFPSSRRQTIRPSQRDTDGNIWSSLREEIRLEQVLGSPKSGQQWDIWQAVYSPVNESSGYPAELFDKNTGKINRTVAQYWIETWDLSRRIVSQWDFIGSKLVGKLYFNVGTMDNFYLNVAVKALEKALNSTINPESEAYFNYGVGYDHCYSGGPDVPTAISRLTINQRFIPEMAVRIIESAPDTGASLDWTRY